MTYDGRRWVLDFWMEIYEELSDDFQIEFLERPEVAYLAIAPRSEVRACIRKFKKLASIRRCVLYKMTDPGPMKRPDRSDQSYSKHWGDWSSTTQHRWNSPPPKKGRTDPRYK